MMRLVSVVLLVGFLTVSTASASPPAPAESIRVRDYAVGDCITDDTAAINAAIAAWQAGAVAKTTGVLDFGSGCYRTTSTIHFGRGSGKFTFGTITGDSPLLAVIHPDASVSVGIDFLDVKYSSISGLGVTGVNKSAGSVGILFSRPMPYLGMGTNNLDVRQLLVQNFDKCVQLGETATDHNGAAAAGITFTQLAVQNCNTGIYETAQNTLSVAYHSLNMTGNGTGFDSSNAHSTYFYGGDGIANGISFNLRTEGTFLISGWREEPYGSRFLKLSASAPAFVSIRDSLIYGNGTSPAIDATSCAYLTIENSSIGGDILTSTDKCNSLSITNSGIFSTVPWKINPREQRPNASGLYYSTKGNYRQTSYDIRWWVTDFPDAEGRAVNGHP